MENTIATIKSKAEYMLTELANITNWHYEEAEAAKNCLSILAQIEDRSNT